jgi:hypothetical protein
MRTTTRRGLTMRSAMTPKGTSTTAKTTTGSPGSTHRSMPGATHRPLPEARPARARRK